MKAAEMDIKKRTIEYSILLTDFNIILLDSIRQLILKNDCTLLNVPKD